jgi:hypothetical protein
MSNAARALPGRVSAIATAALEAAARRALLREYFQACIKAGSLDKVPEVFGSDLKAVAADLGLLAYTRGLYDGAIKALDFGKKLLGRT